MSLSYTNSSAHFCVSPLTVQNKSSVNYSNHSAAPLQQFVQMQAAVFGPPVVAALSSWAWSLFPTTAPLSSISATEGLNIARNKAADLDLEELLTQRVDNPVVLVEEDQSRLYNKKNPSM